MLLVTPYIWTVYIKDSTSSWIKFVLTSHCCYISTVTTVTDFYWNVFNKCKRFQSCCNIKRIINFFSSVCAEILAVIKVKVLCNAFCLSNKDETVFIFIFGHSCKVSGIGWVLTGILKLQWDWEGWKPKTCCTLALRPSPSLWRRLPWLGRVRSTSESFLFYFNCLIIFCLMPLLISGSIFTFNVSSCQ